MKHLYPFYENSDLNYFLGLLSHFKKKILVPTSTFLSFAMICCLTAKNYC